MIGECWEVGTWRTRPERIMVIKDTGKMVVYEYESYGGKKLQRRQAKRNSRRSHFPNMGRSKGMAD